MQEYFSLDTPFYCFNFIDSLTKKINLEMSYTLQSKAFCVVTTNDSENCLLIQFPLLHLIFFN